MCVSAVFSIKIQYVLINRTGDLMRDDPISLKNGIFLISEIGLNHNGDYNTAEKMILASAKSGADAVKFQTYNPEKMYSVYNKSLLDSGNEDLSDRSIIDFFAKFCFNQSDLEKLKKTAEDNGVIFFSAPFDGESVDTLEKIGVKMYKIASSEVTHSRLLEKISACGKPVIMSTGFSGETDIHNAVRKFSPDMISLLHCVSLYPLKNCDAHLSRINALRDRFSLRTGFSDHSPDNSLALFAAYAGATIIEKHFTLSRTFDCPDGNVSITPEQMLELRKSLDEVDTIMGKRELLFGLEEEKVAKSARRSLFASRDIVCGEVISDLDIIEKRPGVGISADKLDSVIGKKALKNIPKDHMIRYEFIK